jgi:hypothetical protein
VRFTPAGLFTKVIKTIKLMLMKAVQLLGNVKITKNLKRVISHKFRLFVYSSKRPLGANSHLLPQISVRTPQVGALCTN